MKSLFMNFGYDVLLPRFRQVDRDFWFWHFVVMTSHNLTVQALVHRFFSFDQIQCSISSYQGHH